MQNNCKGCITKNFHNYTTVSADAVEEPNEINENIDDNIKKNVNTVEV